LLEFMFAFSTSLYSLDVSHRNQYVHVARPFSQTHELWTQHNGCVDWKSLVWY
jgi:hypothetical protein